MLKRISNSHSIRNVLVNIGAFWTCVIFTLCSVICSVLITWAILYLNGFPFFPVALAIAIIAPTLITPVITLIMVSMFLKVNQLEQEQRQLASYDHLTGLMARRLFFEHAETLLKRDDHIQSGLVLVLTDMDNFKNINDSFGHLVGDEVLKQVATILSTCVGRDDWVARLGGDEFVLLLNHVDKHAALSIVNNARKMMGAQPVQVGEKTIEYQMSYGIAQAKPNLSLKMLIHEADNNLYEAKRALA